MLVLTSLENNRPRVIREESWIEPTKRLLTLSDPKTRAESMLSSNIKRLRREEAKTSLVAVTLWTKPRMLPNKLKATFKTRHLEFQLKTLLTLPSNMPNKPRTSFKTRLQTSQRAFLTVMLLILLNSMLNKLRAMSKIVLAA